MAEAGKKTTAKKKTTGVTEADLKKIVADIDAKFESVNAAVGLQLGEQEARGDALEAAVGNLPAEMQASMKAYIAENVPAQVRAQVFDMCDTILLYGIRDTAKRAVGAVLDLGKKVGGLFIRETTDKVKSEAKRHKAARKGDTAETSDEGEGRVRKMLRFVGIGREKEEVKATA